MEENKTAVAKKHSIVTCERKDIIIEGVAKSSSTTDASTNDTLVTKDYVDAEITTLESTLKEYTTTEIGKLSNADVQDADVEEASYIYSVTQANGVITPYKASFIDTISGVDVYKSSYMPILSMALSVFPKRSIVQLFKFLLASTSISFL